MDARTFTPLAELSVVIRLTPFSPRRRDQRALGEIGLNTMSLDCGSPFALIRRPTPFLDGVRLDSIWTGSLWSGLGRGDSFRSAVHQLTLDHAPRVVVVDLDGNEPFAQGARPIIAQFNQARSVFGDEQAMLVRLRNEWLTGGWKHLADVTALRHLIEEWNFGAALDLARAYDPTWEAEAAIMRLGTRLRLLRLPTAATDRHAVGLARVSARALGTALESSLPPTLALEPSLPLVLRASPRARRDELERAASAVINQALRMRAQRAQFLSRGLGPNVRG